MLTGHMRITATEFKAKCLRLMNEVGKKHETIAITKRGEIVAQLVPPPASAKKPWLKLAGAAKIKGDIVRPTVPEKKIDRWIKREAKNLHGAAP
jgi:prevent-host-death family protein